MDERERLLKRLEKADVPKKQIEEADEQGRLASLAVELALGGRRRHTLSGVAREGGISNQYLRELYQAIGRPNPERGERAFTDEDVELAKIARTMLDAGLPRRELTEVARVIGQGMSQSADAVRRLVGDALLEPGLSEYELADRYTNAIDTLAPVMPELFGLIFRAHLRGGISRELISEAERKAGRLSNTQDVAIAFADLVDYTRLGDQLEAEELGSVAGRFAELAVSSTQGKVRLVKTIGDAAMFVSPEVDETVATVIELRDCAGRAKPELPDLRIGVACGPATPRAGDWFGATVNLASRVTEEAKPGQLLATEEVVEKTPRRQWKKRRKRGLKGVDGRVRLFSYEAGG
jgi:adenylate cyclase